MPIGATGASGTDGELLVVDEATGCVHNFWQLKRTSDTAGSCASYGRCHVSNDTGFGSASPFLGAGITAIGASMLGGLIVQAETDAGEIPHAIGLKTTDIITAAGFTSPAIAGDGSGSLGGSRIVIEGWHRGIPQATVMPTGMSVLGQKNFRAMKTYGAIINDKQGYVCTKCLLRPGAIVSLANRLFQDHSLVEPCELVR